jgi:hypothetical protein
MNKLGFILIIIFVTLILFGCTTTKVIYRTADTWEIDANHCELNAKEAFMKACQVEIKKASDNNIEPWIPYGDCQIALTHVDVNFIKDPGTGGKCRITFPDVTLNMDLVSGGSQK